MHLPESWDARVQVAIVAARPPHAGTGPTFSRSSAYCSSSQVSCSSRGVLGWRCAAQCLDIPAASWSSCRWAGALGGLRVRDGAEAVSPAAATNSPPSHCSRRLTRACSSALTWTARLLCRNRLLRRAACIDRWPAPVAGSLFRVGELPILARLFPPMSS